MASTEPNNARGAGTTPPYVSFKTFKTFMADLHEQGVPGKIDKHVLRRFSGSVGKQLMTALRFLDLVDGEDRPTDLLRGLHAAFQSSDWSAAVDGLLREQYAPIFAAVDLSNATPLQVHQAFKDSFGGNDAVLKKSEVFFLQAVQDAAIPLSKRITVISRQRGPSVARKRPVDDGGGNAGAGTRPDASTQTKKKHWSSRLSGHVNHEVFANASQTLVSLLNPIEMDEETQTATLKLITYFRKREIEALLAEKVDPETPGIFG